MKTDEKKSNTNGNLKEAKRILNFAKKELKEAEREKNELKIRQAAEKGYLALLKAVDAMLVKRGVGEEELPNTERGRKYLLSRHGDRDLRAMYGAIRHELHIDTFHEARIDMKTLKERFEDIDELIKKVEAK